MKSKRSAKVAEQRGRSVLRGRGRCEPVPEIGAVDPIVGVEQPHPAEEAAQAAGRVGAAREAEDEDLVAGLPPVAQEAVGLADVARQPQTQHPALDLLSGGRPDAGDVLHLLRQRVGVLALAVFTDPVNMRLIVRVVPGAVAADNQTLRHNSHSIRPENSNACTTYYAG